MPGSRISPPPVFARNSACLLYTSHIGDFERILQLPENTFADVKGEAETLAGLMLEIKRDFLKKGDVVTTHDLRFTAHTIEGRRIDKVQVTLPE